MAVVSRQRIGAAVYAVRDFWRALIQHLFLQLEYANFFQDLIEITVADTSRNALKV